ncbi:MAG: hypothetical protein ACI9TY_001116 [Alphaproteobacteria bacterium]|jgi:hypothetical protein
MKKLTLILCAFSFAVSAHASTLNSPDEDLTPYIFTQVVKICQAKIKTSLEPELVFIRTLFKSKQALDGTDYYTIHRKLNVGRTINAPGYKNVYLLKKEIARLSMKAVKQCLLNGGRLTSLHDVRMSANEHIIEIRKHLQALPALMDLYIKDHYNKKNVY